MPLAYLTSPVRIILALSHRLADFDISVDTTTRATVAYTRATKMGAAGTDGFMAPEVHTTGAVPASDIFSFGCTIAAVAVRGDDPSLDALAFAMTNENPDQRPVVEEALHHVCFADIWRGRRAEEHDCVMCYEDFPIGNGLLCTDHASPHFVCNKCLAGHVRGRATQSLSDIAKRNARICCPGAAEETCASAPYADDDLAVHLRASPGVFTLYLDGRKKLLEQSLAQDANLRLQAELKNLIEMDQDERKVLQARMYIVEEILNLKCPRCHAVFIDFSGCFALKCASCPCSFCAWCLADCGSDAHAHVAQQCSHKPSGAQKYHGSFAEFEAQNLRRRKRMLDAYLADREPDLRRKVLLSMVGDLVGLGECLINNE